MFRERPNRQGFQAGSRKADSLRRRFHPRLYFRSTKNVRALRSAGRSPNPRDGATPDHVPLGMARGSGYPSNYVSNAPAPSRRLHFHARGRRLAPPGAAARMSARRNGATMCDRRRWSHIVAYWRSARAASADPRQGAETPRAGRGAAGSVVSISNAAAIRARV